MEFKVGDRVRFIENSMQHEGIIIENCGRWDGYLYDNYLVKTMIGEFNILAPSLVLIDSINETKIEELEQRIERLEKEVFKPVEFYGRPKETKPSLLTEDERVILSNLDKKWKWIARDKDELLCIFNKEPFKDYDLWINGRESYDFSSFKHLFQFIKWTDSEPYNIEELLKGDCGNE